MAGRNASGMNKTFSKIAHGLQKKPEALLAFGLCLIAPSLAMAGVDEWLSCLTPLTIYILYIVRAERSAKHDVDMARAKVEKLERERGTRLAQRKQKIIAKVGK